MAEKDYTAVNQALNDLAGVHVGLQWLPHYVSVRHRTSVLKSKNIFLSKLIALVRAHDGNIVNFYCAHCRDNLSNADSAKHLKHAGAQRYQ